MALNIVAGQTAPIVYQLFADGVAYPLTGCTVEIDALKQTGATAGWDGTLAVTDSANGEVTYSPAADDFVADASKYLVRFKVTRADGKIEYFPTGSREVWTVRA